MTKKLKPLLPYMPLALAYCRSVNHPALFMEMRLRKSPIVIRACRYYRCNTILIVCPYSAFSSWQYWLKVEDEPLAIELTGTSDQRYFKMLNEPGKYFIINKEGYLALPQLAHIEWDAVVLDESRFIHNPARFNKSKRFGKRSNSSKFFCTNFRTVKHRFILSGLPAPESELEYFQQLQFLDPSILGLNNYYEFRHRYFGEVFIGKHVMFRNMRKKFALKLKKSCFFMSRKDAKIGGEKIYIERTLKFTDAMKKVYIKLVKEFILKYEEVDKRTKNAPVKFAWLRQLCSGYVDMKLKFPVKVNALLDLINNELDNQQMIIWCCFICEIKTLNKKIKGSKYICGEIKPAERNKIKDDFRTGKFNVLIIQPETEKYGADFSFCTTMIYFSLPLGLDTFIQSSDRMITADREESILIIVFLIEKSLEMKIYKSLQKKNDTRKLTEDLVKHLYETIN